MMRTSYNVCEVMGIPIRVHVTLLIFLPLLALYLGSRLEVNFLYALVTVTGFFVSIALHELGHSAVAMRYGCSVRQILLMPIGGVAQLAHMPASPRAELWIALAGPAVSLALCIVAYLVAIPISVSPLAGLTYLFMTWSAVNLVYVLFNLLPSFPMDGGRVFRALMTPRLGRMRATYIASRVGRIMAVGFGIYGLIHVNLILVAIAFFIYNAAGSEYRMMLMQEGQRMSPPFPRGGFGAPPRPSASPTEVSDEVLVSPPPYARTREPPDRTRRGFFDRLFGDR